MPIEEKIQQSIDALKIYEEVLREINEIDKLFNKTFGENMREYQKEFIFNIATSSSGCFVKKCRQAGISTAYAAHVYNKIKKKTDGHYKVLICCRDLNLSKENYNKIAKFCSNLSEIKLMQKCVTHCSEGMLANKLCGNRFDEVYLDEASFLKDFPNTWENVAACICGTGGKIIAVSTPKNEDEDEDDFVKMYNRVIEHPGSWKYQQIDWYEIPYFNKHLIWKKILVEPTIDEEGNVKYDKERWVKLMKEGWMPTSPKYEKLKTLIGENIKNELLN